MGNIFSLSQVYNVYENISQKRKRNQEFDAYDEEYDEPEVKRFRYDNSCVITTSPKTKHDIVLLAFGRRWPCHRSVLSQSNFFKTLLSGSFRESKLNEVKLHTNDDLINETSFQRLLDVMYNRTVSFVADDVFNIIVTAQYFQMDDIVDFCEDKISKMTKSSNCIDIYHFSDRYFFQKTKENVFQWMLLRLFPVRCWDLLNHMTIELAEKLIGHPRLVTQNEMYLYYALKILIQIYNNGTCLQDNESFYNKIKSNSVPFLCTEEGVNFQKAFQALRLGNILVRKENVEVLINDNIIPRSAIEAVIVKNWMSLIAIESPDNFGPSFDLVKREGFETHAMRFAKIIHSPDYHSWKFLGFSFAFDLAMFFDGRTLIIKRVHQINEHKISHTHLLRQIMLRWDIAEMNSVVTKRQQEIQTITMTTNEEICLKQLKKEPRYPCRVSIEVLFHVPYKAASFNKNTRLLVDNDDNIDGQCTGNILKTSITAGAFKTCSNFQRRLFNRN